MLDITPHSSTLAGCGEREPGRGPEAEESAPARPFRVLIVLGHPRGADSLCGSLAHAYGEGAREAGVGVDFIDLSSLRFDPDVRQADPRDQPLEPGLQRAKERLEAAHHVVFVFPTWWGTYPARLKGFLDRVLLPGAAFAETTGGTGYEGLLRGRTAEIITTMDTPPAVYRLIYRQPGVNAMARATLGFCGLDVARTTVFGPVKHAEAATRDRWLMRAGALGRRLEDGPLSRRQNLLRRSGTWLRALRLQFYPMAVVGYALGAFGAGASGIGFDAWAFAPGLICILALEASTVLSNDLFDFETDRRNRLYSPFTGGARVLVENRLTRSAMRWGSATAFGVALLALIPLLVADGGGAGTLGILFVILAVLAVGYTVPPLRLCYRGFGELDVALTHSFGVILFGYIAQGGAIGGAFPFLASIPLFVAVLPSIILAGIPDEPSDRAVGKGTLAVRLGCRRALYLAAAAALLSPVVVFTLIWLPPFDELYRELLPIMLIHGLALAWLIRRYATRFRAPGRIDGLMAASLLFVVWPGLLPLIRLVA